MGDVDDYIEGLDRAAERAELERLHALICARLPEVGQRTSYNMPTYVYRGKGLASIVVHLKHIGWYPHSGHVVAQLGEALEGYSWTPSTLRFTPQNPLTESMVEALLTARMKEIDDKLDAKKPSRPRPKT